MVAGRLANTLLRPEIQEGRVLAMMAVRRSWECVHVCEVGEGIGEGWGRLWAGGMR